MHPFRNLRRLVFNPLWLLAIAATIIVACGGEDPTATTAPAPVAPAATTAAAATSPEATEAPAPSGPTISAPGARPQVQATPTAIPTAAPTAVQEPEPSVEAKIQRVRMANPLPLTESNRIWSAAWSILIQHDPYGETLVENDPYTAEPTPALAHSWEVTPDFKTWTFNLREGIPWHFGFGEFTAADVEHTYDLITREDGGSNFKAVWNQFDTNIVDDYTIEFTHEKFFVDGGRLFSRLQGDLVIQSKAQWDAAGGSEDAYDERPAGTGSYQYGGRVSGQSQWFERIDGEHWGGEEPDFQELEWVWSSEQVTRLSQLLAGEVQAADLSRDVQLTAIDQGMKVLSSNNENNQSYGFFGGTYLSTVDSNMEPWPGGVNPYYEGPEPWHDVRVREAFNRAVDRDAIVDAVYFGKASPVYVPVYAPFTEGWSDRWVDEFDEKYGYDPERSRELLAEAGYGPGDISIDMMSTVIPGNPEIPQLIEVLSVMWEDIGVNTSIQDYEQALGSTRSRTMIFTRHLPS